MASGSGSSNRMFNDGYKNSQTNSEEFLKEVSKYWDSSADLPCLNRSVGTQDQTVRFINIHE